MDTGSVEVKGLQDLETALSQLADKEVKYACNAGLNEAAKIIVAAVKANVLGMFKRHTGHLEAGIIKRFARATQASGVTTFRYLVGLRLKPKDVSAFYGRFLEMGTKYISPRHFFESAFRSSVQRATQVFADKVWKRFDLYASRAPKGSK